MALSDTFTDVDGTSLDAHTMTLGGGWTENAGDWLIVGNQVQLATEDVSAPNYATASFGAADMDVSVSITFDAVDSGARAGLCLREGSDSLWEVYLAQSTGEVELWANNAGVRTLKEKAAHAFNNGDTLVLRGVANGESIAVYVNGSLKFTATNCTLNLLATRCGLWAWGVDPTAHRWDGLSAVGLPQTLTPGAVAYTWVVPEATVTLRLRAQLIALRRWWRSGR